MQRFTHHRTTGVDCPKCGRENDRSTGLECARKPEPGDVSVCFGCYYVGIYSDDGTIREPTEDERREMAEPENAKRIADAIQHIKKVKGEP